MLLHIELAQAIKSTSGGYVTYRRPGYVGAIARMIAGVAMVLYKSQWLYSLNLIALFNERTGI